MKRTILIHNPRCSKSREAIEILTNANIKFEIIDYLKVGLKEKLLLLLPSLLGLKYIDMIRKKENIFLELNLSEKNLSDHDWVRLLQEYPVLLERPIFIHKGKGVIGRPAEKIKLLF